MLTSTSLGQAAALAGLLLEEPPARYLSFPVSPCSPEVLRWLDGDLHDAVVGQLFQSTTFAPGWFVKNSAATLFSLHIPHALVHHLLLLPQCTEQLELLDQF